MISRIETLYRRVKHYLSRSVLLARLLRLPASKGSPTRPGLIMIQVDGLSQAQLERALAKREMPFLKRLIEREHYQTHAHYSGIPSTTPVVQGELFYGVKGGVPAFSFKHRESGEVLRMFEPWAAAEVEDRLAAQGGVGLLKDGSAYSDNFVGGAAESHFCASSMGWGSTFRAANPLVLIAFLLSNLYSFVRVGVLVLLELGLAFGDFLRGLARGFDFVKELKFIPTRVGISILLRELCVIGGKIDIARGLPVVHINFLGYDEQSHRRGPGSLFAHWTLKGIDDAIARLWRAGSHGHWRHYEVWVYSDHGQADVRPYHQVQGYRLEHAVNQALERAGSGAPDLAPLDLGGVQTQRVRLLGGHHFQRLFSVLGIHRWDDELRPVITAAGPVGHLYVSNTMPDEERDRIASELANRHRVPVVLFVTRAGRVRAHTSTGVYQLPLDRHELFGHDHPFIEELGDDLVHLCRHEDAGDFVLLGWREGIDPITFAEEGGAHGGASPMETNGFALLPGDTRLPKRDHDYLRPLYLRRAALQYLQREPHQPYRVQRRMSATQVDTLRVMTYNVHSCIGMDGKLDVERIARLIARVKPDVVALQELDVGRERSAGVDQAHLIARYLEMGFHFHPAIHLEEERYGDAILTHLPERLVKSGLLPGLDDRPGLEPRGALWVAVEMNGREVQIINTHLGLSARERMVQTEALLGADWLGHEQCRDPVILCGDFNALPSSRVCRRLAGRLSDVQVDARRHRPRNTFPTRLPLARIDHIYTSGGLDVSGIQIPRSELARVASDHLPLVVDVRLT